MRPRDRQEKMLTWLAQRGTVSVPDLARFLSVSEMTVRRDLRALRDERLLAHVGEGAAVHMSAEELTFEVKSRLYLPEKQAIARLARTLIEPDMTVAFSAGTTTWAVARQLGGFQRLTFVTNSTNIAMELQQQGWSQIILSGGNFRTPSDALVGPFAEYTIRHLYTDLLFLGVHGLDPDQGIGTPNIQEASIDQAFIEHTKRVVVVMDHTKWGIRALAHIAPVERIDTVVTGEHAPSNSHMDTLRRRGVKVMAAPFGGDPVGGTMHG